MAASPATVSLESYLRHRSSPFHRSHPSSTSSFVFSPSRAHFRLPSLLLPPRPRRSLSVAVEVPELEEDLKSIDRVIGALDEKKLPVRPCELYVCNLPRSYEISNLLELFKPHGTVLSVEVSRNQQTGISRGSGYVTMGSMPEANSAIYALDGSDVAGREMRVKFSVDMTSGRKNMNSLNSPGTKNFIFESPFKIYVGNLSWFVRPRDLREFFTQFGPVLSTKILHDRKRGKHRVYAFLSFSTPDEVKVAAKANGSEFNGRVMMVREVIDQEPIPNVAEYL